MAKGKLYALEHFVHQRATLHDVSHQHKKRDGKQHIVVHGSKGALHHQVKNLVVQPRHRRVVKSHKTKQHAQPHQGKSSREPHHDHNDDQAQHRQAKCSI